MTRVSVKVISQEGHCAAGQKVGDEVIFDWGTNEIERKMCLHALYSILPKVYAMGHGASVAFVETEEGKVARHACPDGYNPVIYELKIVS